MRQCAISDSGNDSDSMTTVDSPYFCEDSSDENDENDKNEENKVWHLKMLHIICKWNE